MAGAIRWWHSGIQGELANPKGLTHARFGVIPKQALNAVREQAHCSRKEALAYIWKVQAITLEETHHLLKSHHWLMFADA